MVSLFKTMGVMVVLGAPYMDHYRLERKSLLIFNLVNLVLISGIKRILAQAILVELMVMKKIVVIFPFKTYPGTLMELQRSPLKNF